MALCSSQLIGISVLHPLSFAPHLLIHNDGGHAHEFLERLDFLGRYLTDAQASRALTYQMLLGSLSCKLNWMFDRICANPNVKSDCYASHLVKHDRMNFIHVQYIHRCMFDAHDHVQNKSM